MFNLNRACQHLRLLGIENKESSRFSNLIQKWHNRSGPEWTVDRLKSLELFAKDRFSTGVMPPIPIGWAKTESRRYKERFKDDLLHELFSSGSFDIEVCLHFCRLSSAISLHKKGADGVIKQLPPSKRQLRKVVEAIESPDTNIDREVMTSFYPYLMRHISLYPTYDNLKVIPMQFWPLTGTSAPFNDFNGRIGSAPRNQNPNCWSLEILYHDATMAEWLFYNLEYATNCIKGVGSNLLEPPNPGESIFRMPAGVLSSIQEGGCKLRAAANPWIVLQAINEPLKQQLKRISLTIPQIVSYNQEEGKQTLQKWLLQYKKVWSLDASSFTDRFPLEFQLEVLKRLLSSDKISPEMYSAFEATSSLSYYYEPIKRNITYMSGQPQGLGPSFALATLAHYELLSAICLSLDLRDKPFRVLGDDVIIANQDVAHLYQIWMKACNVDINLSKSIISNSLGEFAGSQITRDKIISRPRLKNIQSNDQVVSLFDNYNQTKVSFKFFNKFEEEFNILTRKLHVPSDFGGRREQLYYVGTNLKPLNQFLIMKKRLIKEIDQWVTYSSRSMVSFFENVNYIRTGMLHSPPFIDPLSDLFPSHNDLRKVFDYDDRLISSSLEKVQIDTLYQSLVELKEQFSLCKDEVDLRRVIYSSLLMNDHGYLVDNVMFNIIIRHPLEVFAKLVKQSEISERSDMDPSSKRKNERIPSDSTWVSLLNN